MSQNRGLGKGLGALIPSSATRQMDENAGVAIIEIPLSKIVPNKNQPRHNFNEESLSDLSDSIREFGIIQPIVVRSIDKEDNYEIISGERRFRASVLLGLNTIPCIINPEIDDLASLEMALIENIQRDDLTPIELSHTFKQLIEEFKITHEELAKRIGKSRAAITNSLRLLLLPLEIQKMVDEDKISAGHARTLLGAKSDEKKIELAQKIIEHDLSVRETEKLVNLKSGHIKSGAKNPANTGFLKLDKLPEVQKAVSDHLEAPVNIKAGKNKGKIEIIFGSIKDFERIVNRIIDS